MKNILTILTLFLIAGGSTFAYKVTTFRTQSPYYSYTRYNRPYYNRWDNYYNNPYSYQFRRVYNDGIRRIERKNQLKKLERIRRNYYNNFLSWNPKNAKGVLTGYSVPVGNDIYEQMGISPYDPKKPKAAVKTNNPNCNQELFSAPSGDETYYNGGRRYRDLGGVSGKTGVTIIYD